MAAPWLQLFFWLASPQESISSPAVKLDQLPDVAEFREVSFQCSGEDISSRNVLPWNTISLANGVARYSIRARYGSAALLRKSFTVLTALSASPLACGYLGLDVVTSCCQSRDSVRAAESASGLEQGSTKALAVVYGPHETRGSRSKSLHDRAVINCQFSTAERKRRPHGDRKSSEMSLHLKQTFEAAVLTELYPRSQIDIYVKILQADGGNYSACVNAATLALVDAGIPMRDYVCACTN
ncbi:exosome complex component RRP41-like [Sinocyclocheilus rhinocerous]|uniref:exosome complex component RRP41-like n=1 Tax=Sinocyclocheilus rhinocerous TaxID=307959 RepID=UPI0007B82184|nr:PREDICTED: exosome complex component RRP41-like [Sinocyclocheilus rhinocerous]